MWFGGIDNAVNLLDNMDGLAAGVTAIAALGLAVDLPRTSSGRLVVILPVALAGALRRVPGLEPPPGEDLHGQLRQPRHRRHPCRPRTDRRRARRHDRAAAAAALILVVPLFDTTFVVLLRRLAGRSTTRGNIDHMSHRLVVCGLLASPARWRLLYALGLGRRRGV